ncbi:MAG: ribulose-phosphate 3-epimerase [Chitinispirillia bacterium]|jgi:ribulose-phosphate 3-epimerase
MGISNIYVAPSILSADFRILEKEVKIAEKVGADLIHCDIMDGSFVPNISFGPVIVNAVKKSVSIPLDVHLMIVNPEKYIKNFIEAGADIITVHAEACRNLQSVIRIIKNSGSKVGVTVNPDKPIDLFIPYLSQIDLVLIMTVFAGFGGQKFLPEVLPKIKAVYNEARRINHKVDIEVDGGIDSETARICGENGANVFVAGSYVFNSSDYAKAIKDIRNAVKNGYLNE